MSIHPKTSAIGQDSLEIWPVEVEGLKMGPIADRGDGGIWRRSMLSTPSQAGLPFNPSFRCMKLVRNADHGP